jgi:pyrroloquinoline quinone biosynthesis protein E
MEECEKAAEIIDRCGRVLGVTIKDHVSDYFMVKRNTWGSYGLIVNPEGYVYPMIEGSDMLAFVFKELNFDNVRSSTLAAIWKDSPILGRYRGTEWLREPCTSCPVRDECRGGSRLNSFILTREFEGADPFCVLSPDHGKVLRFYKNNDVNVLQPAPARPA